MCYSYMVIIICTDYIVYLKIFSLSLNWIYGHGISMHKGCVIWQNEYCNMHIYIYIYIVPRYDKYIFIFCLISRHWHGTSNWYPTSWITRNCLPYSSNAMPAEDLVLWAYFDPCTIGFISYSVQTRNNTQIHKYAITIAITHNTKAVK